MGYEEHIRVSWVRLQGEYRHSGALGLAQRAMARLLPRIWPRVRLHLIRPLGPSFPPSERYRFSAAPVPTAFGVDFIITMHLAEAGRVAGRAQLSNIGEETAYLYEVLVEPEARGQRAVEALIEHAATLAKSHGAVELGLAVAVWNRAARRSYRRAGFATVGMKMQLGSPALLGPWIFRWSKGTGSGAGG